MGFVNRSTQLKLRRLLRRKQTETSSSIEGAAKSIDKNFFGRFSRLARVKRFVLGWLLLAALLATTTIVQAVNLSSAYQSKQPVDGGTLNEGMVGTFSTSNPIFASGSVDVAVSKLIFSGLVKYDKDNNYDPDLAEKIEIDDTGKIYTITLRKNLTWHDGAKLTADDVVYTYKTIQNSETGSPLAASVHGVSIEKVNDLSVKFTLNSALASFPSSLVTGILPKHLLGTSAANTLRSHPFNTNNPVGSGPFKWRQLQIKPVGDESTESTISLDRFDDFHAGRPKLDRISIKTYPNDASAISAFERRDLRTIAGLKSIPSKLADDASVMPYEFQTTAAIMTFFNTQSASPVNDAKVRKGIMYATNRREIIKSLDQSLKIVREPVLTGQSAFDPEFAQPLSDISEAKKTLDEAGWVIGDDGVRAKEGKKLTFQLFAEDTEVNKTIVEALKKQWKEVGVDVQVTLQPSVYLQTTLETRSYDAVLHGISIGNDPDVYAYWHSSQAESGANFSNYRSSTADTSLEAGRTRQSDSQRALKYKPFLKAWYDDTPAVSLFRPKFYYISRGAIHNLDERLINTDSDRYYYAHEWQINSAMVNQK